MLELFFQDSLSPIKAGPYIQCIDVLPLNNWTLFEEGILLIYIF